MVGKLPFWGCALASASLLSGCIGNVSPAGLIGRAVMTSAAMEQVSAVSPEEQASFASLSCAELQEVVASYESALDNEQAPTGFGGMTPMGQQAVVRTAIRVRLDHLNGAGREQELPEPQDDI